MNAVVDPGLNFGRGMGGKVQKVPKLAKISVKKRKTMAFPSPWIHHCRLPT